MGLAAPPPISDLRSMADKAIGFRDALRRQIQTNDKEVKRLENEEELLQLVAGLIRALADAEVTEGMEAVTKLQTEGLQEIFNNQNLSLEAQIREKHGKVTAELLTVDQKANGMTITDTFDQFGGSVATVESVILRVIVILRRGLRPLLLLDETLSAINRVYIDRMAGFLTTLCTRLDMDILAVTHDQQLIDCAQKAYVISVQEDGSVVFKEKK